MSEFPKPLLTGRTEVNRYLYFEIQTAPVKNFESFEKFRKLILETNLY